MDLAPKQLAIMPDERLSPGPISRIIFPFILSGFICLIKVS